MEENGVILSVINDSDVIFCSSFWEAQVQKLKTFNRGFKEPQ